MVSLAATGMYYTGGTVMIDHGHGLHSIYVHLSEVLVAAGQRLERGAVLGTVGMTGRATGPHLHWGSTGSTRRSTPGCWSARCRDRERGRLVKPSL